LERTCYEKPYIAFTQHFCCVLIAQFNERGNLPEGVHRATWKEVCARFGTNQHRQELLFGLNLALFFLKKVGCKGVYLDGSFVTSKEFPKDVDCLWDPMGVNLVILDPAFRCDPPGRNRQKLVFRGDYFPSSFTESVSGLSFLDFFQIDKETGDQKGIVQINLEDYQ